MFFEKYYISFIDILDKKEMLLTIKPLVDLESKGDKDNIVKFSYFFFFICTTITLFYCLYSKLKIKKS